MRSFIQKLVSGVSVLPSIHLHTGSAAFVREQASIIFVKVSVSKAFKAISHSGRGTGLYNKDISLLFLRYKTHSPFGLLKTYLLSPGVRDTIVFEEYVGGSEIFVKPFLKFLVLFILTTPPLSAK